MCRLWNALDSAEAKRAILAVTPRVHIMMTCQSQDVADTAGDLHDLGTEPGEVDYCRSCDDRHLCLHNFIFFGTFRARAKLELPPFAVTINLFNRLACLWIDDRQLLVE